MKIPSALLELREEISNIDYKILTLLEKRFKLAEAVGEVKAEMYPKNDYLYLAPTREVDMIKEYITNIDTYYIEPTLVYNLWRNIISYTNFFEQPNLRIWYNSHSKHEELELIYAHYPISIIHEEYNSINDIIINQATVIAINSQKITNEIIEFLQHNFMRLYHMSKSSKCDTKILFFAKVASLYDKNDAQYIYFNQLSQKIEIKSSELKDSENMIFLGTSGQ